MMKNTDRASERAVVNEAAGAVIFLDIDGPMIPCTMYLVDRDCSFKRVFPATTIATLAELLKRTGAKIVCNTTHNQHSNEAPDIVDALVSAGIPRDSFHADDRTRYPSLPRDIAVKEWLANHQNTEWIAIDDTRFTDDPRLIWTDPDSGLHTGHLNEALERFGEPPALFLI